MLVTQSFGSQAENSSVNVTLYFYFFIRLYAHKPYTTYRSTFLHLVRSVSRHMFILGVSIMSLKYFIFVFICIIHTMHSVTEFLNCQGT